MAASSSAAASSSSTTSLLESRFQDWESTLKHVTHSGYASSEETLSTNIVQVFVDGGSIFYREHNGHVKRITKMHDIPSKCMHFLRPSNARYAGANSLETARVEALTTAIYDGIIKITGRYACVNHIGTYPNDDAPELTAKTPVPIKLQRGQEANAILGCHEIIVARKVLKKIHVCHFKSEYSPTDDPQALSRHRIYFAGAASPEQKDARIEADDHYTDMECQAHLGSSREVLTDEVEVTAVGLTNGLIAMFFRNFKDQLLLKYSSEYTLHVISTLVSCFDEPRKARKIWESDIDGRHIEIFSEEDVKVNWLYDAKIWLSDARFATDRCLHDDMIQKAARQFKHLSLEKYARMIGGNIRDIVAAYQRRMESDEQSVRGDACYLFQGDGKLAKDSILASPLTRDQLEGVALLATPHGDYSLRYGYKVMYSRDESGIWHIDLGGGDIASIPGSDLVGADLVAGQGELL